MIFKRKSFHLFSNIGNEKLSSKELEDIMEAYEQLTPLCPDIKTCIKIVPAAETTCKRGIMPTAQVSFYNRIDVGIFLCFFNFCLVHEGLQYERILHVDEGTDVEKTLVAVYK